MTIYLSATINWSSLFHTKTICLHHLLHNKDGTSESFLAAVKVIVTASFSVSRWDIAKLTLQGSVYKKNKIKPKERTNTLNISLINAHLCCIFVRQLIESNSSPQNIYHTNDEGENKKAIFRLYTTSCTSPLCINYIKRNDLLKGWRHSLLKYSTNRLVWGQMD